MAAKRKDRDWSAGRLLCADAAPSPDDRLVARDAMLALGHALKKLCIRDRNIITARFCEEFTLGETAEVIGYSRTHTKVLQDRLVQRLRRILLEDKEDADALIEAMRSGVLS